MSGCEDLMDIGSCFGGGDVNNASKLEGQG